MKKIIFISVVAMLCFTCNNSPKEQEQETQKITEVQEEKKSFVMTLHFKTNKDDVFKIMMNNIVVDELQTKNIHITEKVSPSTGFDRITAKFDPDNISQEVFISLGNAEFKEVQIKSIDVSYGDKAISASTGDELNDYFAFNKHITFDALTNTIKTNKVDGTHTPTIILRRKVINSFITE
ncbi:hypothetical protein [Psychroserpens algicola]|uniref:hypothetical protein n=1 Tax=Psychroserpens algicola TaxID=1719034 RepID=UPI001952E25C|nr:hypothetical protein [Psychroserpens algicola]